MRYPREVENADDDRWTDWIRPLPGYKIACCDCGLVHDMESRVDEFGDINFRFRRNLRSTGQFRRHKRAKEKV